MEYSAAALLAQHGDGGVDSILWVLFNPATAWVLIPIVAIIVFGLAGIIHQYQVHRERMAMIERGIHPDKEPVNDERETNEL